MSVSYIPPPGDEKFVFWKKWIFQNHIQKDTLIPVKMYNVDELGRSESLECSGTLSDITRDWVW
jgi:hypothetical protein